MRPDGTALIDPTGVYRYLLTRTWDSSRPSATWVMLNPSTADAGADDATIRRARRFSERWGFGSLAVVNLFAYRTSSPSLLRTTRYPVGPGNDQMIENMVSTSECVIAAWGNSGTIENPSTGTSRSEETRRLLSGLGATVRCLEMTQRAEPRHPLYVPGDTPLRAFPG